MTAISFGLSCTGMVLLSLSLPRHYLQVWPGNSSYQRWQQINRIGAYSLLAMALLTCLMSNSAGPGLVLWFSLLAAAGCMQAMLLSYWPKHCLLFSGLGMGLVIAGLLL